MTSSQLVSERLKASQVQEVEGLQGRVDERQRVEDFLKSLKSEREFPRTIGESAKSWIQALLERANFDRERTTLNAGNVGIL